MTVDAGWIAGNATQNFWRSAENLALNPVQRHGPVGRRPGGAVPADARQGGLNLARPTAAGPAAATSPTAGSTAQVSPYSQQQWYTRDSSVGGWNGAVWNMVFSGVTGAPAQSFPNPPYTTLDTTPVSREKPFLYTDSTGDYKVFVPSERTNARGVTWANGTPRASRCR